MSFSFSTDTIKNGVAAKTTNCLFANGTTTFGTNPVSVTGSAGFKDAANGDYHLAGDSKAIGAGVVYDGLGVDLDGAAFSTKHPALGCYERLRTGMVLIVR